MQIIEFVFYFIYNIFTLHKFIFNDVLTINASLGGMFVFHTTGGFLIIYCNFKDIVTTLFIRSQINTRTVPSEQLIKLHRHQFLSISHTNSYNFIIIYSKFIFACKFNMFKKDIRFMPSQATKYFSKPAFDILFYRHSHSHRVSRQ